MKRAAVPFLIALGFLLLPYPSSSLPNSPPTGILLRPQETIQTTEDIDAIVALCETYRISNIFLLVKQDTGPESGSAYYSSARIPRISDFDVLLHTIERAHRKNIKVYAWIPLLYDKRLSEQGMGINDNWICPLQSESHYRSIVTEVKAYDIDGILFDYLRFPDDVSASDEMKTDFGEKSGYDIDTVDLSLEKERNTLLWQQWISYRDQTLVEFLKNIVPELIPVGMTVTPEDIEDLSEPGLFALVTFVASQTGTNPVPLINKVTLLTDAEFFMILPNEYVSEVRQLLPGSMYADLLIFDSVNWDECDFQRIKKAEVPFTDIRMTRLAFMDFFNDQYSMEQWRSHEVNTVILPAGHIFWTYFKYEPYKEKWSTYTKNYDRDFVEEMLSQAQKAELYTVLELNIQSEEYVIRYKDAASITYEWSALRRRVCLNELNNEPYKTEFFEMAKFVADNYRAEALLIADISYLEDCFCTDCLQSYIEVMAEKGVPVEDWPRLDGEIDIYDATVREWKTAQIIQFLRELREYLRDSNKELWVEVPVSATLEDASSEYGLYLPEVEMVTDRIVLTPIDLTNPPRVEFIVMSLPTPSKYILNFFVESDVPPARTYLLDSLQVAYDAGISDVGLYPQSEITDTLWGAFYIAYAYKLALTNRELMELYNAGDYGNVISSYPVLIEERKEEEWQSRERARQNIEEAERSYSEVPPTLEEAKQVTLDVTGIEAELQQNLEVLGEAQLLFIEGEYGLAEERARTAIIEFSTLNARIKSLVEKERIKRITSGIIILVVFLLIMMFVRFRMKWRK
jgi:hypothetical protein